jgi:His-Xaa-Ser system radical SAM maturase HxsC
MTEQCNSFCLMCSQPPRRIDDSDRVAEHLRLIELIDEETAELGITGGEPTLFGDDFLRVVASCKDRLPRTALHVLTNGRAFFYRSFARQLGAIGHEDLMLGIPLYAAVDTHHDFVVQARGAFEETVLGLHHLAEAGVAVEIRIVLHEQTYRHLPLLAEFIARNFPFAAHVALMGLELFGFARPNIEQLWVDPVTYGEELRIGVETLAPAGLHVSIYNHQLCTIPRALWPFAVRSISDWKNVYFPECEGCSVRESCGGFFASSHHRRSAHIRAIL